MRALAYTTALGFALAACTLIADIDREKIPEPMPLPFPEVDAGTEPDAAEPPPENEVDAAPDTAPAPNDADALAPLEDAGLDAADAAG